MLPLPKHLKNILRPIGNDNNEFELTGKIICNCSSDNFEIKIVGDDSEYTTDKVIKTLEINDNWLLIMKVSCKNCNKDYLIFDKDFHGWDGFVCGETNKNETRPEATIWRCEKCGTANHSIIVSIQSQGQEEFMNEGGEEFDKNDWVEAFSWITIKVKCKSCGEINEEWISYETM